MSEGIETGILERCTAIEECYEFMLAYAAKGLPREEVGGAGSPIRQFLDRAASAISGLAESCALTLREGKFEPAETYKAFLEVLDRDAQNSLAAIELVRAQPSISSQLVDNLNASIHLRALLTDLFLLGDVVRSQLTVKTNR
ncbi:MAG TPA: hypothetical protein VEK33_03515 [Terriglobales bacterium]|nr:hypothetical protein [Terriglobales bacterium]